MARKLVIKAFIIIDASKAVENIVNFSSKKSEKRLDQGCIYPHSPLWHNLWEYPTEGRVLLRLILSY